ncbi:MAG: YihY/virulence factor BrkB family protein [Ramlibacter sp.]|nr:YihY/virulence factor BrkB family protein [Ramlibacter sp.]
MALSPFQRRAAEAITPLARPFMPIYRAVQLWRDADGMRMAAAMSFYGILSLAPLLVLLVALLGWWMDRSALEAGLVSQIGTVVGPKGAGVIRQTLESAREPAQGLLASAISFGILLFGATGVFGELQSAMERLWVHGTETRPASSWWHTASMRLRGVGYVLAFGFLLLVSLALSTLLNIFSGWASASWLPLEPVMRTLNELVAFAVCAALFVGLMRMSTGPKPRLRHLVLGACVGAALFTVGRHVLAAYLSTAAVVSAYGAAGALVVLLMWIYFSSAILLLSAGSARALEEARWASSRAPTATALHASKAASPSV